MKKSELTGWQKVFSFTVVQNYKSKSAVAGLIVMCLLVMLSGPVMSLVMGSAAAGLLSDIGENKIENVIIRNDTGFVFDTEEFAGTSQDYSKINFSLTDASAEDAQKMLGENSSKDIVLDIHWKDDCYMFTVYRTKDSDISTLSLTTFSTDLMDFFRECRMKQSGVSEDSMKTINSETSVRTVDESDITKSDHEEMNPFMLIVVTVYAMIIMMIVLVSSQQISMSIVTEKSSKVIETLLLSVRPLAIITGKIAGTMVVILINFTAVIFSGSVSAVLTSVLFSKKYTDLIYSVAAGLSEEDIPVSELTSVTMPEISIGRIVFGIFSVVVTTVLAYLFYCVISGLSGASCSSIEDLQGASTFISLSTVIGVYMAMGSAIANNAVFTQIAFLFPFSGIYMVPVYYLFGKASVLNILILWAEVSVLTVLTAKFAAGIYHVLIYHKGERLKLKNIIELSKAQKGRV